MSENSQRDRLMAGAPHEEEELDADKVLTEASDAVKERWLGILIQLTNSKRFNEFLENNYEIRDYVDEEAKSIQTLVIEKPQAVGPSLTSSQVAGLMRTLKLYGVREPERALKAIFGVLGQEERPVILDADGQDTH